MAYEARVRQDKMRAELSAAKKESAFYLLKVDQAKAIEAMEERKRLRADSDGGSIGGQGPSAPGAKRPRSDGADAGSGEADALQQVRRKFKQRRVVGQSPGSAGAGSGAAVDERVLGSLLGTA